MNSDCPSNMTTLSSVYIAGLRTQKDGEDLQYWPNKFVRVPSRLQIDHPLCVIFHQAISQLSKSTHHQCCLDFVQTVLRHLYSQCFTGFTFTPPVACPVLGCATPPPAEGDTTTTANGRLAMMAIIGMFFQDGLTGSAWATGPTTPPLPCEPSRMNLACKLRWDFGTLQVRWVFLMFGILSVFAGVLIRVKVSDCRTSSYEEQWWQRWKNPAVKCLKLWKL